MGSMSGADSSEPNKTPMSSDINKLDLATAKARLESAKGRNYWRSLEELAATDGFEEMLHREFPRQASEWDGGDEGRRNFLKLMGASLALGGLSACTKQPVERIYPYVNAPETIVPGKALYYATAFTMSGISTGILMESHMGRPTKVEGNPQHPASLGSTDVATQASVLGLYDPDRSQTVNFLGEIRSYPAFVTMMRQVLDEQATRKGSGIRIVTETIGSPTLAAQMKVALAAFPAAKWIQWEPIGAQSARLGSKLAFGEFVNTIYKFDAADVVVSLDSDFLCSGPASARYARDFATKRRVRGEEVSMSRMYAIETTPQTTGAKADHRISVKPSEFEGVVRALAAALGVGGAGGSASPVKWFNAMVKDLQAHRGSSIVIAGEGQSPEVHALVHAINGTLGNVGKTLAYTETVEASPADQLAQLKDLAADLDASAVEALFIIGGNPVYNAPVDLALKDKLSKAKLRVHLGLYQDETSELCQWHIPEAHPLEYWSDGRAYDGTTTIMQPLIAPLYDGHSPHEFLAIFSDSPVKSSYDSVREYWQKQHTGADFEAWWRRSIHDGLIAGSAFTPKTVSAAAVPSVRAAAPAGGNLELSFHADPYIYDGRYANNGWLQELPRPLTRLTWDNAVMLSAATAKQLNVVTEDLVELKHGDHTLWGAVWVLPGQPNDSVAVHLGFGRTKSGRAGNGAGFDAYKLRTSSGQTYLTGVTVRKLDKKFPLASVQMQSNMAGRPIARLGTISEYKKNNEFAREMAEAPPKGLTIYPESWRYEGYAWGMSIDLNACTGCNACVVACQSENNISIVGKDQVKRERAMHWLRIDRYYVTDVPNPEKAENLETVVLPENPGVVFEPVGCVHCENAPCEIVCPVAATVHDQDGINNMIYNRCVGTRYCSNNCPYKVRRFNFYLYSDWDTESLKMQKNPDVSVRSRGVMEKCTYCIQRINAAKINAEREDRKVVDGDIVTACQAACPSQAISFGDLNDPKSEVRKLKQEGLSYGLLSDLNTRPRTTHMAALRNPNPEIEAS
jgi:MoCo/4Fe-4S cofactor protein with predicted Tat translocation signal